MHNVCVIFMAKVIKEWSRGSVSIAVEARKDDMNREGMHVHIYKRGRRTDSRITGRNRNLDDNDFGIAENLHYQHVSEIESLCQTVKDGRYDA